MFESVLASNLRLRPGFVMGCLMYRCCGMIRKRLFPTVLLSKRIPKCFFCQIQAKGDLLLTVGCTF